MNHPYAPLAAAIAALAGTCDRAATDDGVGFNGGDAEFGHVLASRPPQKWSPKMASAGYRIARRYRGQLQHLHGIDFDKIKVPSTVDYRGNGKPAARCTAFDAKIDGGEVILSTGGPYPGDAAISAVKSFPPALRRYNKTPTPRWIVQLSAAEYLIAATKAGHINAGPGTMERFRAVITAKAEAVKASSATDAHIDIRGLGGELYPFQRAGVFYAVQDLATRGIVSTFLADEMGLGKTVQALAVLQVTKALPAVIVVPASLKLNWLEEVRKWLPTVLSVRVLSGRKHERISGGTGIVIINYDILGAWQRELVRLQPKAVIFDESHKLKNGRAQRTKAAKVLAAAKSVVVRLLLTGTPIVNMPYDLISQLQILGRLKDLGGWKGFTRDFCIPGQWGGWERGGKNLPQLNAKMRASGMYVRRLKENVLTELPAKQRVVVPIEITTRRAYDRAVAEVATSVRRARLERAQARDDGREPEGWALAAAMVGINRLRQEVANCKMKPCFDWIRDMLETGEKLVIFGRHIKTVETIAAELKCPMIRGGVSQIDRQAAVKRFQEDPKCRAIVLNIEAGGVGLTLTASSNVVFVEEGDTPAANDQAEDRTHRIGQRDQVTAWYLLARGTIDDWQHDLVARKRATVDAGTDGTQQSVQAELAAMIEKLAQ